MAFRIKVHVQPGMFASERTVSFTVDDQRYEVPAVDEFHLHGDDLDVEILDEAPGLLKIRLPSDTVAAGRTLWIPQGLVKKAPREPCEYEIKVLRAIRDQTPLDWGAAVGQALEVCTGSGWATRDVCGRFAVTPRGEAVLAAADSNSPPDEAA